MVDASRFKSGQFVHKLRRESAHNIPKRLDEITCADFYRFVAASLASASLGFDSCTGIRDGS